MYDVCYALQHHLTNSSQSALAISQSVSAAGSFVFALPGGWLGDKLGPRPILIGTGFATCVFPVLNAYVPDYTCVLAISFMNGVISGLAAGSNGAFQANCLPLHPRTGQVLSPARDQMLFGSLSFVMVRELVNSCNTFIHDMHMWYCAENR